MLLQVKDMKPEEVKSVIQSVSAQMFAGNVYARRRGLDKVQLFVRDERAPGAMTYWQGDTSGRLFTNYITARYALPCHNVLAAVTRVLIFTVGVKEVQAFPSKLVKGQPITGTYWDPIGDDSHWKVKNSAKSFTLFTRWCICFFNNDAEGTYNGRFSGSSDWQTHLVWPKAELKLKLGGKIGKSK